MEIIDIQGIPVHYVKVGKGFPVLCLHGWGVDHRILLENLEPVFLTAPASYTRIYPDLPGMGQTPGPDWITGSDDMVDILVAFIEKIIPEGPFLLSGLSYGGYLAKGLLTRFAERVEGVLLVCPAAVPYKETPTGIDKGFEMEKSVLEEDLPFLDSLETKEREMFGELMVRQNRETWQLYQKAVLPGIQLADQDFLNTKLSRSVPFARYDIPEEFRFDKPGLIFLGRQDTAVGWTLQEQWLPTMPRTTFLFLDAAGHNLPLECGAVFTAAVLDWLKRINLNKGDE